MPFTENLNMCFVAFFAFVAVANAGHLVLPSARIIQGPSSRTTVVGPDGSAISSVAPGGQIIQEESVGVVAHSAPVVAAPALSYSSVPLAYAAHSSPIVSAYSSPLVSGVPVVSAYSAPLLSGVENTVVVGPSGSIVSGRSVGAPVCFVAFVACLAVANAGVAVLPSAKIIQGPSSRTTVVGPDGSAISSVAPAGQIIQEESVGVVAQTAPVVAAPAVAYSAPAAVAYSLPAVASAPVLSAYSAPIVSAYSAPVVSAYAAPLVSGVDTVVAGPSGTIATGRTVGAPVVSAW
ncbi:hypothetical protein YQE_08900, partial [Dendroctonus ponderosae]